MSLKLSVGWKLRDNFAIIDSEDEEEELIHSTSFTVRPFKDPSKESSCGLRYRLSPYLLTQ